VVVRPQSVASSAHKKPRVSVRTELFISRRKNSAPGILSATNERRRVHSVVNNITSAKRRKKCIPNNTTTRYTWYYIYVCAHVCTLSTNTCKRLPEIGAEIDSCPRSARTHTHTHILYNILKYYVLRVFFYHKHGYQSCVYYYYIFLSVTIRGRSGEEKVYLSTNFSWKKFPRHLSCHDRVMSFRYKRDGDRYCISLFLPLNGIEILVRLGVEIHLKLYYNNK